MIEIDAPMDAEFHKRRAAAEETAALRALSPHSSALHRELATLHSIAARKSRLHARYANVETGLIDAV